LLGILLLLAQPIVSAAVERKFALALPGYKYSFPRDHGSHDEYKTEWWYYTGHLKADDGGTYGYELTFFRLGSDVADAVDKGPWNIDNLYLAHFAVSDIPEGKFFNVQELSRSGKGFAGASNENYNVWLRNWSAKLDTRDRQLLKATSGVLALDLVLTPDKPPVIHGIGGVSQKASCYGCASHYYSMTRLLTEGTLTVDGKARHVKGLSWMDHEFGSNQLTDQQVGWDWFSIQLDDKTELMLYRMRLKNGKADPNSSGTFVAVDSSSHHLLNDGFVIKSTSEWKSPATGATYPMGWLISVPGEKLELEIKPQMLDQELVKHGAGGTTYWEGACTVKGTRDGKQISGSAYVEMTGYAQRFSEKI
jgi:predicted secreted hydrolase